MSKVGGSGSRIVSGIIGEGVLSGDLSIRSGFVLESVKTLVGIMPQLARNAFRLMEIEGILEE